MYFVYFEGVCFYNHNFTTARDFGAGEGLKPPLYFVYMAVSITHGCVKRSAAIEKACLKGRPFSIGIRLPG
jgi:hypothetical protein